MMRRFIGALALKNWNLLNVDEDFQDENNA